MANIINSSASLAEVIIAINSCETLDAETKQTLIGKACTTSDLKSVIVNLNYYFARKEDEAYDMKADFNAIVEREKLKEEQEQNKLVEEQRKAERLMTLRNMAADNLARMGVKMFDINGQNPEYNELFCKEFEMLKKGKRILQTADGSYFSPDMEMNHLSDAQRKAIEKADIDDKKSNRTISLESERPMTNGEHFVKIVFYRENKGRDGKPDYATVMVEELGTGKRTFLNTWSLEDPARCSRADAWKCRLYQLRAITSNSVPQLEGMSEDEAVEYLREHYFTIYTWQRANGKLATYVDQKQYDRFISKQIKAEEAAEKAAKRAEELDAMGLNPDEAEEDESMTGKEYKF